MHVLVLARSGGARSLWWPGSGLSLWNHAWFQAWLLVWLPPVGQEIIKAIALAVVNLVLAVALAAIVKIVFRLSLANQSCNVLHVRSMS